ncbi:MAG TPA: CopG family transcriptional regulator [Methylococcaceae bacterium]|nr:CopG family transcriptional regulator [Methylococcaceae bacterium]
MRTTLDIDDDVLAAAKELSRQQHVSAGQMISRLLRKALAGTPDDPGSPREGEKVVGGFRPFPSRGLVVSNDLIDNLRDAEGV